MLFLYEMGLSTHLNVGRVGRDQCSVGPDAALAVHGCSQARLHVRKVRLSLRALVPLVAYEPFSQLPIGAYGLLLADREDDG